MGYALKPGETSAPADVQARYDLLVRSIQAGMRAAVPGVKGWEVDKASRDIILEAGYPSYKHGTGHQLGCGNDHAPGVAFTQLHTPEGAHVALADLAVREGYVMTIEPRLQVANGASIEVDGIITKEGFKPLVPMQERIHLI
jgi:Xaa-Pro aminopeptidase